MQEAVVVLDVLRERGRKGLPFTQLYRQMFNKELYLLAYGNIYSNQGAMTPGASAETADGMSEDKIDQIIEAMRHERYRFCPARRVYIPRVHRFWSEEFRLEVRVSSGCCGRVAVLVVGGRSVGGEVAVAGEGPEFEDGFGAAQAQRAPVTSMRSLTR